MATSVTVNGGYVMTDPVTGQLVAIVDATVGGKHHQAKFLLEDLKRTPAANLLTYVAKQFLSVDAAATVTTAAPVGVSDFRGTVSI